MFLGTGSVKYKNVEKGAYVGAYVEILPANINFVQGSIPCRPMKGATGVFTNEDFQRIDIRLTIGADSTLDALVKGDFLKLSIDNGAIVMEEEFKVSANVAVNEDGTAYRLISLTPALKGLDGEVATVAYSLHA